MRIFAFAFARGGSKGVPGKNIRPLRGKPLLAYSIAVAKQVDAISRIFVSTDSDDIAGVALACGAEVIKRPPELARDDTPEWLAWRHALAWLDERGKAFDVFVSLPATSPLRSAEDVNACLAALDEDSDVVVTMTQTSRSPWFNMVRRVGRYVRPVIEGDGVYTRRQDVPEIYDMTTVAYVTRPDFIRKANGIFEGRVKAVLVPQERALDIDTEFDFAVAEALLRRRMEGSHVTK